MSSNPSELSNKRFIVSIYEVRQEILFAEEFSGHYAKDVTRSDGTSEPGGREQNDARNSHPGRRADTHVLVR